MVYRTFNFTLLFLLCCFWHASAYPDHLLHKPYAVQYLGVDSILSSINNHDSATVYHELAELEKWAEAKGDQRLKYAFKIREYVYASKFGKRARAKTEGEIPELIKELEENKMPELEAQALNILAQNY